MQITVFMDVDVSGSKKWCEVEMVTVKLMGGLGNQMFQYACGRSLANDLGEYLCGFYPVLRNWKTLYYMMF